MSSTYTPDPTATQAPAATPDPDDFPLETLPVSGDGATAASVAQAFKVLGDYVAWLKAPRAVASSWLQALRRYKNARLQDRFGVNHQGMPDGLLMQWEENWDNVTAAFLTAYGATAWFGRWMAGPLNNTVATVGGNNVGLSAANGTGGGGGGYPTSHLVINTPFTGGQVNVGIVEAQFTGGRAPIWSTADTDLSLSWDFSIASQDEIAMGLLSATLVGSYAKLPSLNIPGVAVMADIGASANYRIYTCPTGGTATISDTGIAISGGTRTRARIEIRGANVSDDSTARAILYINGAIGTNSNVAVNLTGIPIAPFWRSLVASGLGAQLFVGPARFKSTLGYPGSLFI